MALMIQFSCMVYAGDEKTADTTDIDFIEFLGSWETADGEWIDPNELATDDAGEDQGESDQDPQPEQDIQPVQYTQPEQDQ